MNKVKIPASDRYHPYKISHLKDPTYSAGYLTVVLEEEEEDLELDIMRSALRDVFEALGDPNMSAEEAKVHLQKLDDLLSKRGSAAIYSLGKWLNVLGLKLTVTVMEDSASYGDEE